MYLQKILKILMAVFVLVSVPLPAHAIPVHLPLFFGRNITSYGLYQHNSLPQVCIPRNSVYHNYVDFCSKNKMMPVNAASFGKVRGSESCYHGFLISM